MFGLGKSALGPLSDPRSAERWLASLPANDPLVVERELLAELRNLSERTARRTPTVLEAVFVADARANNLVRTLTAQYAEHANRSPKIEKQLWQALFDLTQGFEACYAAFAREITDRAQHNKWHALLPELLGRQMVHLGRDAKVRLYHCEHWIPAKWAELHAPFIRACAHQVERQPLMLDAMSGATTLEREYLAVLVLQLADPGNLAPKQIEWVAAQLDEWCRLLRLTLDPKSTMTFYVDLAGSAGLKRRSLGPLEGRVLFVDTQPLYTLLLQNRAALEQAVKNDQGSEKTSQHREQLELFIKIASRIDPEFRPLSRRGERIPASGAVDAIVGFSGIADFLRGDKATPTADSDTRRSFGNTMELAVFGRTRTEPDHRFENAQRRLAAFAAPGGPWEIKDTSASGFRLHAPMSVATEVTLSMVVAIHQRGQDTWVLGIVRRMRRLSAGVAEIGLQLIANTLVIGSLIEQRKLRDGNYALNGDHPGDAGRRFYGLFLSFHRRAGDSPVQSLIVPPVEYQVGRRYTLQVDNSVRTIRFGRLIEQQKDWVWTVIDPLEPDAAPTDAPPRQ